MAEVSLLGDWIAQQLERFNAEPGDKTINHHTSVWLPIAKRNSDPGASQVKVALAADDPAQLVVDELQTRLERESLAVQDEFAKRFSPAEKRIPTIRDLRFALQWTAERLQSGASGNGKRGSTPAKRKAKKAAPKSFFIEQAMRSYHKFDGGFVDRTIPPTSGRKLSAFAKNSFSARSVDRWIEDRFESKEAYESACLDGSLGPFLAVDADSIRAFGTSDQLEHEVTDGDDDERDAPTIKARHGKRKPKVRQRF